MVETHRLVWESNRPDGTSTRRQSEPMTRAAAVAKIDAIAGRLPGAPNRPVRVIWSEARVVSLFRDGRSLVVSTVERDCPLCADITFGPGPRDYHGPDDVHPGVTCADIAGMEW